MWSSLKSFMSQSCARWKKCLVMLIRTWGDVVDVISLDISWEAFMGYLTTWYDIPFLWRKINERVLGVRAQCCLTRVYTESERMC